MSECFVCGARDNTVEHHVSYDPEETVPTCRSCHTKIHKLDDFRPDLTPENVPEERRHTLDEDSRYINIKESVHTRLAHYGNLNETFSQALARALDEAGAPEVDEDA